MTFRYEHQLVTAFEPLLVEFLPDNVEVGLCKREKGISWRWFADLMLGDFDADLDDKTLLNLTKITGWMQHQMARTARKPMTPESICDVYKSPKTVKRYHKQIRDLIRWGWMEETEEGFVAPSEKSELLAPKKSVAFELKLSNWREAVGQAENYLRFCHESWVVMPRKFEQNAELIALCEEKKLGFAVVEEGICRRVVEPKPVREGIKRRKMCFNLLVDYARHRFTDRWFYVEP